MYYCYATKDVSLYVHDFAMCDVIDGVDFVDHGVVPDLFTVEDDLLWCYWWDQCGPRGSVAYRLMNLGGMGPNGRRLLIHMRVWGGDTFDHVVICKYQVVPARSGCGGDSHLRSRWEKEAL